MGEKAMKRGAGPDQALRLLPADFDSLDTATQDTAIGEALSHIAEMEILRTRKRAAGDKSVQVAPAIISRNLLALSRLVPGATSKFRRLIDAARGVFGLSSARALTLKAAIREGRINESEYEAFLDKMTGRNHQAEHDGMVRDEHAAILGQEVFTPTEDALFSMVPDSVSALLSMNAVNADSTAFEGVSDKSELRKVGEQEYAKLVGQEPVNIHDGRKFEFTLQQFGKPKSHSADPRIMKLVPALPDLLKNAVLLDTEREVDQEKYRNIDAWHTYGVRAVLDGQALFVQLSTFEQNGVEMVGLYHDHNVLTEEAYQWGKKNGEKQSGGPTDPVTNRAVTPDALAKSKMYQILASVKKSEYSLAPASMVESLSLNAAAKIKDPRVKAGMFQRMTEKLGLLKRDRDELGIAFGKGYKKAAILDPRKEASIKKESAMRKALRRVELEDEAHARHGGILHGEDLSKLWNNPVWSHIARPDDKLHGRIMSLAAWKRRNPGENYAGEYDGSGDIPRVAFGGDRAPDQIAQELYDAGLIKHPTPDALWQALASEAASIGKIKEAMNAAKQDVAAARLQAKEEAKAWEWQQIDAQKANYSPRQRLLRALAMLDGILSVLPPEVRGKIGGHTMLAKLASDEARLKFLNDRIEKADVAIDAWIKDTHREELAKLIAKSKPAKNAPGEAKRGKINPLFPALRSSPTAVQEPPAKSKFLAVLNSSDAGDTDASRPGFAQRGNTYFPIRNITPTPANNNGTINQFQYYGLATPFENVTLTGKVDYDGFDPIRFSALTEIVKNVAFDENALNAGAVNNRGTDPDGAGPLLGNYEGGDMAYYAGFQFGKPKLEQWGDWLVNLGYRYVESDSVVDGFADSNFGGGGTNVKGYHLGASFAVSPKVRFGARWLASDEIAGPPLSSDTFQLDLNANF